MAFSCEGNLAAVEGACRLIENESVEPDAIAEAGFQVIVLATNAPQLYCPLKTAPVSAKHSVRTELGDGDIGGPENSISKGIWAHSVMLPDADNERTVERLRLLCAANVQRLSGSQTGVCSGKVITDQRSPDVALQLIAKRR